MTGQGDHRLYEYQPSFILGFHGCDESVGEDILHNKEPHLLMSEKEYDWLGSGIYFWEGSVARAWEWAEDRKASGVIKTPFVLGAIIDLGHCLDLFDRGAVEWVKLAHDTLEASLAEAGQPMPRNKGPTPDRKARTLDCAVMNSLHKLRERQGLAPYQSIRGPFLEGDPIYEGAGFRSHTHIQIAVRDTSCIKGYFRPIKAVA
jgi:hypothetical protein